jgi:hypothetical protein
VCELWCVCGHSRGCRDKESDTVMRLWGFGCSMCGGFGMKDMTSHVARWERRASGLPEAARRRTPHGKACTCSILGR